MPSTCELFAGHNIRCTTQRQALYEALAATDSHPTAEEFYRWVKESAQPCHGLQHAGDLVQGGPGPETTL